MNSSNIDIIKNLKEQNETLQKIYDFIDKDKEELTTKIKVLEQEKNDYRDKYDHLLEENENLKYKQKLYMARLAILENALSNEMCIPI